MSEILKSRSHSWSYSHAILKYLLDPQKMELVQAAQVELTKRKSLLADQLLSELADIVVSYAVTEYQLFEEALLRRHFVTSPYVDFRGLLSSLQQAKHYLTEMYLDELATHHDIFIPPLTSLDRRLSEALRLGHQRCHRICCYYDSKKRDCICQRSFNPNHIHGRIAMPF